MFAESATHAFTDSAKTVPPPILDNTNTSWFSSRKKKEYAKKLYEDTVVIRAAFGALDGMIISYSFFKYFFDVFSSADTSSADAMHDFMDSPGGAAAATLGLIGIVFFSWVGNVYDSDNPNKLIRRMAAAWPYFRDAFKGLKFAYKGLKSTFVLAQALGADFKSLLLPIGLVLGVASAANRMWYRKYVTDARKEFQKVNNTLLERAKNLSVDSHYELREMPEDEASFEAQKVYLKINDTEKTLEYKVLNSSGEIVSGKIRLEDELCFNGLDREGRPIQPTIAHLISDYEQAILDKTRMKGHTSSANTQAHRQAIRYAMKGQVLPHKYIVTASVILSGFTDGLYTYMGALTLTALAPPLFFAIAACCILFTGLCIINRIHEENEYKKEFTRSQMNVELVLTTKEIEDAFFQLRQLSEERSKSAFEEVEIREFLNEGGNPERRARFLEIDKKHRDVDKLFNASLKKFKDQKIEYSKVSKYTTQRAVLTGLRSGLYIYSATCSVIFALNAFFSIASIAFPPAILVVGVVLGLIALVACVIKTVRDSNKRERDISAKEQAQSIRSELKLADLIKEAKTAEVEGKEIQSDPISERDALINALHIDDLLQYQIQEGAEVIRSCCSGLSKGGKAASFFSFLSKDLSIRDSDGHFQDAPIAVGIGIGLSAVYGVFYALRAFAKGYRGANDVPKPSLPKLDPNTFFAQKRGGSGNLPPSSPRPSAVEQDNASRGTEQGKPSANPTTTPWSQRFTLLHRGSFSASNDMCDRPDSPYTAHQPDRLESGQDLSAAAANHI
jgi:hypothetical protein